MYIYTHTHIHTQVYFSWMLRRETIKASKLFFKGFSAGSNKPLRGAFCVSCVRGFLCFGSCVV